MNPNLFKGFVKDIENLYYKTRLSSIENCFIRLSQGLDRIDIVEFNAWLNGEKRSKGKKDSIYSNIGIVEVLDALEYLYSVMVRYGAIQKDTGRFRSELFNLPPKVIEIISTMKELLGDSSVNGILLPFQPSIELICKIFPIPPYDVGMVKRDLQVIINAYNNKQAQQIDSLRDLFMSLLNKFSLDIGKALEKVGRKDLADKIISGKIMFRPDLLAQILPVGNIDYVMGDKVRDIVSHIMYSNKNPEAVYEYIKKEALDFVGTIDKKQYELQRGYEEMEEDIEEMKQEKMPKTTKKQPMDITESQWLHPRSLAIISSTLFSLYKKMKGQ